MHSNLQQVLERMTSVTLIEKKAWARILMPVSEIVISIADDLVCLSCHQSALLTGYPICCWTPCMLHAAKVNECPCSYAFMR